MDQTTTTLPVNSQPAAPQTALSPSIKYAGFWVRAAALIIDSIVIFLIQLVLGLLYGLLVNAETESKTQAFIFNATLYIISFGYYIYLTYKYKATWGKMAVGLQVENSSGGNLGFWQIFLRETVGKIISTIILCIGYMMAGWNKKKRGLHDFIANTVVIEKEPAKPKTGWTVFAAIAFGLFIVVFVVGIFAIVSLLSLNTARGVGQGAYVKSHLAMQRAQIELHYDSNNNSYKGFVPSAPSGSLPEECSVSPMINVSEDGKSYAMFAKSCKYPDTYYCVGVDGTKGEYGELSEMIEVPSNIAQSETTACPASSLEAFD